MKRVSMVFESLVPERDVLRQKRRNESMSRYFETNATHVITWMVFEKRQHPVFHDDCVSIFSEKSEREKRHANLALSFQTETTHRPCSPVF